MQKSELFISLGKILKPENTLNDVEDIMREQDLIPCDECGCYFPQAIKETYGGYNFCSGECLSDGIASIEQTKGCDMLHSKQDDELTNPDRF